MNGTNETQDNSERVNICAELHCDHFLRLALLARTIIPIQITSAIQKHRTCALLLKIASLVLNANCLSFGIAITSPEFHRTFAPKRFGLPASVLTRPNSLLGQTYQNRNHYRAIPYRMPQPSFKLANHRTSMFASLRLDTLYH